MVSVYSHTKYVLHYFTETNNNLFLFFTLTLFTFFLGGGNFWETQFVIVFGKSSKKAIIFRVSTSLNTIKQSFSATTAKRPRFAARHSHPPTIRSMLKKKQGTHLHITLSDNQSR